MAASVDQSALPPGDRWITLPRGWPQWTLAGEAILWAHKYLRQPDGDHAGEPWRFTKSQTRFLAWHYAIEADTSWVYSHSVRRLPKGAGKSPFAAVMSLMELCAPVRFSHWTEDPRFPDGVRPVGRAVGMPLIQIAATAQDQGYINTMRMVTALIRATKSGLAADYRRKSQLELDYGLEVGKTIIHKTGGGYLHVITSSASAAEGALTTFGVCDQTEAWKQVNGGHDLFQVMNRNAAKSKARLVQTANAWEPGKDSVAEQTFNAWVAEQEGRTRGRARTLMDVRMMPAHCLKYIGDPKDNVLDRAALVEGVAIAYGDSFWADPEDIVDRHILDPKTPFTTSKRFYFNWPTVADDAWIEPWEFARWADPAIGLAYGAEIALGFDGSRTNDATALIACEIETGNIFVMDIWETEKLEGGGRTVIPVDEVDAAVERAFDKWNPVAFFADVREWESFSKVEWPKRYASQLKIHSVPGGRDPQPIAWDMRTHIGEFTAAAEMVNEEITGTEPVFYWDGDSRLKRHVQNARRYPNKYGTSVSKESPDSPNKIDACVAMIIARHARRLYLANQLAETNKKKPRTGKGYSISDPDTPDYRLGSKMDDIPDRCKACPDNPGCSLYVMGGCSHPSWTMEARNGKGQARTTR